MYKITWAGKARDDYFEIVDYLIEKWGKKSALHFKSIVNKQITLISKRPGIYPVTQSRENVRRCIVAKQVSMYYLAEASENEIFIIRFYDNRSNPDGLSDALNESDL
jgi:plasmid stabilization system protein ParE